MEMDILVVADYANVAEGGKLNVMGMFKRINAHNFPALHPEMYLVAKLSASPAEAGQTRKFRVKLLDADGQNEIVNWERDIKVPESKGGERIEIHQLLRLRSILFPKAGVYQFYFLVDNDEKGGYAIEVVDTTKEGK